MFKFKKVVSKDGYNYYYIAGDIHSIWVDYDKKGFGGKEIKFTLEDGSVDVVVGPWNTNSKHFEEVTGINIMEVQNV
jgi:hypothetical protein